jgi:mRNA interferase MazF
MAINFYPKAGMVLMCDFSGSVPPEINKKRPVVVVTPAHVRRAELVAVVPLSTRPPQLVLPYHHRLISHPFPGAARASWAKCDLVQSVSHERLDRIAVGPTQQVVGYVGYQDLVAITHAIATYFGLDPAPFRE